MCHFRKNTGLIMLSVILFAVAARSTLLLNYTSHEYVSFRGQRDECRNMKDFDCPIKVGDEFRSKMYICENGIVTFNGAYEANFMPTSVSDRIAFARKAVVAPYFSNIDLSTSGSVYYRIYNETEYTADSSVRTTMSTVLTAAGYGAMDVFMLVVVTWENVPEYKQLATDISTFQLVIISDGSSNTLTFFSYLGGSMKFSTKENLIGFATQQTQNYRIKVSDPVGKYLNLGRHGFVWFSLNTGLDQTESPCMTCRLWAKNEKLELERNKLQQAWDEIPACPCDRRLIPTSGSFRRLNSQRMTKGSNLCYDFTSSRRFNRQGSICCYKNSANDRGYISDTLNGGFRTRYSQQIRPLLDVEIAMKDICCGVGLCDVFFSVRPQNRFCTSRSFVLRGGGTGDPHVLTMDGKQFTFNGHGEYTLIDLSTSEVSFKLQSRTAPYLNEQKISVGATVYTAFAARETMNGTTTYFTVELESVTLSDLQIKVNGRSWTTEFAKEEHFTRVLETASISKPKPKTVEVTFLNSGVSISIEVTNKLLSLGLSFPNKYATLTRGLLGNGNSNPDDDFIFPNGTILAPNSTERQIFQYGQTWVVSRGSDSVFEYPPGASYLDYQNTTFVPNYLDEANQTAVNAAKIVCGEGNIGNIQCIFDKVFTESDSLATATKQVVVDEKGTRELLANEAPTLTLKDGSLDEKSGKIHVELNKTKNVTLNGSDDGASLSYNVVSGSGAIRLSGVYAKEKTAIIFFETVQPQTLSVTVTDDKGAQAVLDLQVRLCTGCNGYGICDYTQARVLQQNTDGFSIALCVCYAYTTGPDCTDDYNGCADNPCSLNRTCTDNSIAKHRTTRRAYSCGDCPAGYTKANDSEDCIDINECTRNPCSDVCVNFIGRFQCLCNKGRRASNATHCIDINECAEASHNCMQVCSNTNGGFTCSCYPGYTYNTVTNICSPDITSCNLACDSSNGGCYLKNNIPTCFCNNGYKNVSGTCQDINECDQKVCAQTCTNTKGSYTCGCYTGYTLSSDNITCTACTSGLWRVNCNKTCECSSQGAEKCDNVKGCHCKPGWTGAQCAIDVNECADTNICNDTLKLCENTIGSYRCICKPNYSLNIISSGRCIDLDECIDVNLNKCEQYCVNTLGGFYCTCATGYMAYNTTHCIDIDECSVGGSGCAQLCQNALGSYNCLCYFGYGLNADQRTCTKLSDTDLCLQKGLNCSGYCAVSNNTAYCACGEGFKIAANDQTLCIDINECDDVTLNKCEVPSSCRNTVGGYSCSCPLGQFLENNGINCTVCNEFHYGENCKQQCNCGVGASRCDPIQGCICQAGWNGAQCDKDRNECDAVTSPCTGAKTTCVNTPGKYTCQCVTGYHVDANNNCININECQDGQLNSCEQDCTDSEGSYTCSCRQGYQQSGNLCLDIDECLGKNNCNQVCTNIEGSYICTCHPGFILDSTDRASCRPETECDPTNKCGNNTECVPVNGNDDCQCIKGFQKIAQADNNCTDINECTPNNPCVNGYCTNFNGSFKCTCAAGFKLDTDQITCIKCDSGRYGEGCNGSCACVTDNTLSCNAVSGSCSCKKGWIGDTCSIDIDECSGKTYSCPDNSSCFNTKGSYVCVCANGFTKTIDGLCQACGTFYYGQNCERKCSCIPANTKSCNYVNGTCSCKDGWSGMNCSTDINECKSFVNPCSQGKKTICENTDGSYKCMCELGYELNENDTCIDINECQRGTSNCTRKCINKDGSFTCSCNPGFKGTENDCTACTDNTYGNNCTSNCSCVRNNTVDPLQSCDRVTGKCSCTQYWNGSNCETDIDECTENKYNCTKPNERCNNLIGSYSCSCLSGYQRHVNGSCLVQGENDANNSIKGTVTAHNNITGTVAATCNKNIIGTVVGSVAGFVVLLVVIGAIIFFSRRGMPFISKKKNDNGESHVSQAAGTAQTMNNQEETNIYETINQEQTMNNQEETNIYETINQEQTMNNQEETNIYETINQEREREYLQIQFGADESCVYMNT